MNLFQVDLGKPWNYLWYCYEKQRCWKRGCRGCKRTPPKFWFAENLGKSPENPGKNGAQRCLTLKNGAQGLHKNTWRPFWRLHHKEVFMIFMGENLQAKVSQKLYGQVWGNSGKILRTPKICLLLHYDEKAPPPPLPLFWKGRGWNALAMPPFFGIPVHIILHALSLFVVSGYNVSL